MTSAELSTTELRALLDRNQAGDRSAREELSQSVYRRLEQLARQMLRRFPSVRFHEETGDVLNAAMIRFLKALDDVSIQDARHFYALAAEQIRRELLDLARRYRVRDTVSQPLDQADVTGDFVDREDLERWCAFHDAVAGLPDEERDVFAPVFYHDLTQRDLAEALGVHPKTVQRRYRAACVRLYERLGGNVPEA
jgi:RNA polymerase sigma-70 factor (ECF subfamily)